MLRGDTIVAKYSYLSDGTKLYGDNGKETQAFVDVQYTDYGARMLDSKYRLLVLHIYPRSMSLPISVSYEARTAEMPVLSLRYAMRGREQQWIDFFGGPLLKGGQTLNWINGISPTNPNRQKYMNTASLVFGPLPVK